MLSPAKVQGQAPECLPLWDQITVRGLEGVPQRELNEPRRADGGKDSAEGSRILHVGDRWIRKVRVVPNVEEVRCKAQLLPLGDFDVLEQREVPVLLMGTAIYIPAEVSEQ